MYADLYFWTDVIFSVQFYKWSKAFDADFHHEEFEFFLRNHLKADNKSKMINVVKVFQGTGI